MTHEQDEHLKLDDEEITIKIQTALEKLQRAHECMDFRFRRIIGSLVNVSYTIDFEECNKIYDEETKSFKYTEDTDERKTKNIEDIKYFISSCNEHTYKMKEEFFDQIESIEKDLYELKRHYCPEKFKLLKISDIGELFDGGINEILNKSRQSPLITDNDVV